MSNRATPVVPVVPGIDLDFRPASYWADADPVSAIVQNIKGQNRRTMARDFIAGDLAKPLGPIDERLLADTIDEGLRTTLGQIHPSFMGGEYLPDYTRHEMEIARIVLDSATRDVISVRARIGRTGARIRYRMVDEYDGTFVVSPASSRRPLSLRQLIALIDTVESDMESMGFGFVEDLAAWQLDSLTPHEAARFVTVESDLYPSLGAYYEARLLAWADEEQRTLDADGVDEPDDETDDGLDDDDDGGFIFGGVRPPPEFR
jgi:hypothetical protein